MELRHILFEGDDHFFVGEKASLGGGGRETRMRLLRRNEEQVCDASEGAGNSYSLVDGRR